MKDCNSSTNVELEAALPQTVHYKTCSHLYNMQDNNKQGFVVYHVFLNQKLVSIEFPNQLK